MKELWASEKNNLELDPIATDKIVQTILSETPGKKKSRVNIWRTIAVAASVFVAALALFYFTPSGDHVIADNTTAQLPLEHQIIKLPDGSVVKLNHGSSLDYPESFAGKETREVFLIGEGYFDIQHDPAHEFIVRTGNLKTVVLGTAFNIKAYPTDNDITVTVTRGKVRVSDDNNVLGVITPDQQITFNKDSQAIDRKLVDSRNAIAWSDKDIFFDDITLYEAARQLEMRFQVKIRLTDQKLRNCRFTATFVRGENINQMLTVICEFNGAQFVNDESGNIEITGPGC
jgi:ferric-dicitrate binding protein FerR (iron transport regulator)